MLKFLISLTVFLLSAVRCAIRCLQFGHMCILLCQKWMGPSVSEERTPALAVIQPNLCLLSSVVCAPHMSQMSILVLTSCTFSLILLSSALKNEFLEIVIVFKCKIFTCVDVKALFAVCKLVLIRRYEDVEFFV